jgi:hypothetical protein
MPSVPLQGGHMSGPPIARQQVDAGQIPSGRPPVALPRPPVAAPLMHGQSAPAAEASLLERP